MINDDTRSNLDPRKDDGNVAGNLVGEGVGGAAGIAAGAAVGALGGPVGMAIGALAGAIGGWWSGRAVAEGVANWNDEDDAHYRTHYTSSSTADRVSDYDSVRPAYQLGHVAGRNPDYSGRSFSEVESDLQRGWTSDVAAKHGDWTTVRPYAQTAYERSRTAGAVGTAAAATGRVADRVADKVDDMKDRIDGNPASRPGRDATDSPRR
jgi:hypothetical protein